TRSGLAVHDLRRGPRTGRACGGFVPAATRPAHGRSDAAGARPAAPPGAQSAGGAARPGRWPAPWTRRHAATRPWSGARLLRRDPSRRMSQYPPIAELIPHAGPMVLLDAMLHWAEGETEASYRVREGAPFVNEGRVEGVVTIEYMAQAVAACLGYEALLGGEGVRVGMIIACKRMVLHGAHLHVGDHGTIRVKRIRGNDTLSHFDCRLERSGELFAESVLTLYHAEKPPDEGA